MNERTRREPRLFWPAASRLLLAGAMFFVVYGACNRFTATRSDVGLWVWSWEQHIPFVREFIVPYWSLDLFFCGAFFLCRTRAELNLLTKRIVTVILVSGACFLLFPLQMGLPRPQPAGWTAPLFRALYAGDMPYNLAPSLHISLRAILWITYGAHLRGALRRWAKLWFFLIGLSTLLIWQHHVIDVAAGFVAAWLVTSLLPSLPAHHRRTKSRSLRIAGFYAVGALASGALASQWFGFAWPALGCGILMIAYASGRADFLGKENGTHSPAAEWLLLPIRVITKRIQNHWRAKAPAWREVTPGVYYGRRPSLREAREWVRCGTLAVLDLTAEGNAPTVFREQTHYLNLPLLDLLPPTPEAVTEALAFIRQHVSSGRVLIHCELGLGRSARVAESWLLDQNPIPDKSCS